MCIFFLFRATHPPGLYTLSLHDALPILRPTMSAVKSEARMPRLSEMAKPLTGPLAFQNKIAAVINVVDRKSTRLNSSHLGISYAVFCLKKKTKNKCHRTLCQHARQMRRV